MSKHVIAGIASGGNTRPKGAATDDVALLLKNSNLTVERAIGKYSAFVRKLFDNYEQHIQPDPAVRLKHYDELYQWESDISPLTGEGRVRHIEDLLVYKISEVKTSGK